MLTRTTKQPFLRQIETEQAAGGAAATAVITPCWLTAPFCSISLEQLKAKADMLQRLDNKYIIRAADLDTLDTVHVPFPIATIEMEKNAGEYAQGVLRYIEQPDADLRHEIEEDQQDFIKYHANYMRVTHNRVKLQYGHQLAQEYKKLTALGADLMNRRDRLSRIFEQIAGALEQVDVIADGNMM